MEAAYVTDFRQLQEECGKLSEAQKREGISCKGCHSRRICQLDGKARAVDDILHTDMTETRFPALLSLCKKHPGLLYNIPVIIYSKVYGAYHDALPCPFRTRAILKHLEELEAVYALLTDVESRQTLLNVLMYRMTFCRDYILRAYGHEPQYFIQPFRSLGPDEVYVDCGAYTGDTFEEYCRYNAAPRAAYLFEPDGDNLRKMESVLQRLGGETQIHAIQKGIYRQSGELYFAAGKDSECYLSETDEGNGIPISVTSLDEAVPEDISFIKMDIEGSEVNALLGAKKHITSSYPKLAISVYHKPTDLWEIPLKLHEWFPAYTQFVLRHHSRCFAETVLYVYR